MNTVDLPDALRSNPRWTKFAEKLKKAMAEYPLEGVTVVLRQLTAEEISTGDGEDILSFNQEDQRFEFAINPTLDFPPAWKIADRIDGFLNPDEDAALEE